VAVPLRSWALGELDGQVRRSVYRTWAPAGPLTSVVARFWAGDPGWARGIRLLPDGCVDLVWNGTALTLFAAGAQPRQAVLPAAGCQVGARLRCGVAGALFGVDLAELGVPEVPLGELVGAPARRVEHELAGRHELAGGRRRRPSWRPCTACWRGCCARAWRRIRRCSPPWACWPGRRRGWTRWASGSG